MTDAYSNQSLGLPDDIEGTLAKIREENVKRYGTDIIGEDGYGAILLRDRYPDRTHFIYELLQNTEDAYARKAKTEIEADHPISFDLYHDRLEVRHRGKVFDEADVRSICGLVKSTKKEASKQIGKFGIGFKSVFAFTATPIIHSSKWSFKIENYVHPYADASCRVAPSETLIIIPFNREDLNPKVLYSEVKKKLLDLGNQSLLFLAHIDRIEWCIHSDKVLKGEYRKREESFGHGRRAMLDFLMENDNQLSAVVRINNKKCVRVNYEDPAYLEPVRVLDANGEETSEYCKDAQGREILHNRLWKYKTRDSPQPMSSELYRKGNGQIVIKEVPADGYFWHYTPDAKEIALYKDIGMDDEDLRASHSEEWLVYSRPVKSGGEGVGSVSIALSLEHMQGRELKISPIVNSELVVYFPTSQAIGLKFLVHGPFNTTPSRDIIKKGDPWNITLIEEFGKLLSDTIGWVKKDGLLCLDFLRILPTDSDEYVTSDIRTTAIERTKDALLKGELLPRDDGEFTGVENGMIAGSNELRELLSFKQLESLTGREGVCWIDGDISKSEYHGFRDFLEDLGVYVYTNSDFAKNYTRKFAESQTDKWTIEFYDFLASTPSLWSKSGYNPGPFRTKPIIRLEDGSHINPFDENDNPIVFLPSPGAPTDVEFRTVKTSIAKDHGCKKFFNALNIKAPTKSDVIYDIIKKYGIASSEIEWDENYADVRFILDALSKDLTIGEANDIITRLEGVDIFRATNAHDGVIYPCSAEEVFIGKKFTQDDTLERLYMGCESAYFLDEDYAERFDASIDLDLLKKMGCCVLSSLVKRRTSNTGLLPLADRNRFHERAVGGFDPSCSIPHINEVLEHITLDKAVLIWNVLLRQPNPGLLIRGKVQVCSRKDFANCITNDRFSTLGETLVKSCWIPNKEGVFQTGMKLKVEELHRSLEINSDAAKELIKALGITDGRKVIDRAPIIDESTKSKFSPAIRKILRRIEEINTMDDELAEQLCQNIEKQMELLNRRREVIDPDTMIDKVKDAVSKPSGGAGKISGPSPATFDALETAARLETYAGGIKDTKENLMVKRQIKSVSTYTITDEDGEVSDPSEYLYDQYRGRCQICGTLVALDEGARPYFEVFHMVSGRGRMPGADLKCNILSLCPNCWAQMKYGTSDLSRLLEVAEKYGDDEAPIEHVPIMGHGDFVVVPIKLVGKERKLYYTPEHIGKAAIEFDSVEPSDEEDLND